MCLICLFSRDNVELTLIADEDCAILSKTSLRQELFFVNLFTIKFKAERT